MEGSPRTNRSPQKQSFSSKTDNSKAQGKGEFSSAGSQAGLGKMGVAPVLDDDHLVQTKQNDTVGANFGAGKGSSKKRRNETSQNPKGKNGNSSAPIGKKQRPISGGEVSDSHGENQDGGSSLENGSEGEENFFGGESDEEGQPRSSSSSQQMFSSSNTDRSFPEHQGKEGNKGKGVESKVSGKSTEGNRSSSRLPSPKSKSTFGYKARTGYTPDPTWLANKQRKRNLYFENKDKYKSYMLSRRIWDPPVDSDYDHVMIHKLADLIGYRSLAMLLSISLTRLPYMNSKERVMAWADNVINYFGVGTCWENFRGWCLSLTPYCGSREEKNTQDRDTQWAWIAGRLFFSDLTQLFSSETLRGRETANLPYSHTSINYSVV